MTEWVAVSITLVVGSSMIMWGNEIKGLVGAVLIWLALAFKTKWIIE